MNDNHPLLSICIPTYNRSEYLKQTLFSIIENEDVKEEIEVVISDNCSTDNTEEVCKSFTEKYSNIKYFKQPKPTHIADQNFIDVLSLAKGKYLKLSNDTAFFKKTSLKKMLEVIKENIDFQTPIFFYQNYRSAKNKVYTFKVLDDLVDKNSYFITWIGNFGCWKKDFDNLQQRDKYISFGLMQVDWMLKIASSSEKFIVLFSDFTDSAMLHKKFGKNIFKIFAYNYFSILKEYVNKNLLKKETFELEKKRILFRFLLPTYVMTIYQKNFSFDTSKMFDYLADYNKNWYFYFAICLLPVYFIVYGIIFLVKTLTAKNYKLYHSLRKIKARLGI